MSNRAWRLGTTWIAASVLTACGGGGSSTATTDSPGGTDNSIQALTAWRSVLQGGLTYTVTGPVFNWNTLKDDTAEVVFNFQPRVAAASPLDGSNAWRLVLVTSARYLSDPTVSNESRIETYFSDDYKILGHNEANGCSLVSNAALPPTAAAIGATGQLATSDTSTRCKLSSADPIVGYTSAWSTDLDQGTRLFCWRIDATGTDKTIYGSAEYCFESGSNGALLSKFRYRDLSELPWLTFRN